MRQVLFRISTEHPWTFWTRDPASGWPEIGFIWIWLIAVGGWSLFEFWRITEDRSAAKLMKAAGSCLAGIPLGLLLSSIKFKAGGFPLFGYGFMVMLGFLAGVLVAKKRAKSVGLDPELVWDAGIWLLIGGVFGGRLFYLLQYHEIVYRDAQTLRDYFLATINLTEGGLVLIGAMFGGGLGFWAFARRRKLDALNLGDVFTPSIFIGIGFGRIGCLLNGCCFGDRCTLPWGLRFPHGSMTFESLKYRGFVDPSAPFTMPLHPTQIYSSIDGFVLALVTTLLFRERRWRGEVFAWGCVLYSITRFLMEFVRGDEIGQLGTGLTISQLYSIVIAAIGVAILVWHGRRSAAIPA